MAKIDAVNVWSLQYRLLTQLIAEVAPDASALGIEMKELFVLSEIDAHPNPAAVATQLCMPKPSVTVNLKSLEASGFVKREIDKTDLRRHKLTVTPAGRKVLTRGLALLSEAVGARLSKLSASERATFEHLLEKMM